MCGRPISKAHACSTALPGTCCCVRKMVPEQMAGTGRWREHLTLDGLGCPPEAQLADDNKLALGWVFRHGRRSVRQAGLQGRLARWL